MKAIFIEAMRNTFDLPTMLQRINTYHVLGALTDEDRNELEALARQKADPFGGLNVTIKLLELEERIRQIEQQKAEGNGNDASVAEYVAGKWYYKGDKVLHNGMVYACIAPEGITCVWSPSDYPAYWEAQNA